MAARGCQRSGWGIFSGILGGVASCADGKTVDGKPREVKARAADLEARWRPYRRPLWRPCGIMKDKACTHPASTSASPNASACDPT
jgi:hypothetical protein